MPIKYQLKEISNLFKFIKDINSTDATSQFEEALKDFCESNENCREPQPDYILSVPKLVGASLPAPHIPPLLLPSPPSVPSPLHYITGWTLPVGV